MQRQTPSEIEQLLLGYRLTTANILYRMPDHRSILQMYIWQEFDLFPKFPVLHKFLDFWEKNLDGPLHSVKVVHTEFIRPADLRVVGSVFRLH